MKNALLTILGLLVVIAIAAIVVYYYYFPYGYTHCCDKQLMTALESYAGDHDGAFPSGEKSAEASLSLLHPKYATVDLIKGKTSSLDQALKNVERDGCLDAETCSWHYVEGLSLTDDPRFALFWDREPGLGHFGQRFRDGSRTVFFVNGASRTVPLSDWDEFLRQQDILWQQKKKV